MRIAICDDDNFERDAIKRMVGNISICKTATISGFADGSTLLKAHGIEPFDIILLDVDMPDRTGIEIGNHLRKSDSASILIFVTSYPQYAIEAYDCDAFHYLLKPINRVKFEQVLTKAVNHYNTMHASVRLETRNGIYVIPVNDIYYIECLRKNLIYYTAQQRYTVRDTLSNAMSKLHPYGFCQTHQGYIVNMSKIKRIAANEVTLLDNTTVMISVRRQKEVEQTFTYYLERNL